MINAYDPRLRAILTECARELGIRLPEGVYVRSSHRGVLSGAAGVHGTKGGSKRGGPGFR